MKLKRFKFLNNSFFKKEREKKRNSIFESLKMSSNKDCRKIQSSEAKYKYINRLLLYNTQLANSSIVGYENGAYFVQNAGLLKCKKIWPLCLYDHTYKNRCASYFALRNRDKLEIIDNYFELAEEDKRQSIKEEKKEEQCALLLVERNYHFCTNEKFVNKINFLLEQKEQFADAFPMNLINPVICDDLARVDLMEQYIKHIIQYDIPKDKPQEFPENQLEVNPKEDKSFSKENTKIEEKSLDNQIEPREKILIPDNNLQFFYSETMHNNYLH